MTDDVMTMTRPDSADVAGAIILHLWKHPVHDPKCEKCRSIKTAKVSSPPGEERP